MSFLQPWMLWMLPLVVLPIIIHLINQRRYHTIPWAAMMFLLTAHRMARGYSRLRQWLIMACRMLAVAGLLFAVSRPLASGWLGLAAGGKADTTIILLDRSPSMQQRGTGTSVSKLETGRQQLVQALETLGSSRWVLVESATCAPQVLETPRSLLNHPSAGPASAPADLPKMLQAAHDYIRDNRTGRTEIWICSDLRQNDWAADSGRWSTLRDAFQQFPQGVRIHLLAYPDASATNTSVRVTEVRRVENNEGAELLITLVLSRQGASSDSAAVPVQFEIEGARSTVNVDQHDGTTALKEHRIPLDSLKQRGWGRVALPADVNSADDEFYFAFDVPPPRRTVIVSDDPAVERPLRLAATISPDSDVPCTAEVLTTDQLSGVEWEQIALLLWHAPLPADGTAALLRAFIDRGGQAVFFPPPSPGGEEFLGLKWRHWIIGAEPVPVETWRGDEDLLVRTLSGLALPVGQLEIRNYCGLSGAQTPLAQLRGGEPLLARVPGQRGGIYFWATTPARRDSSLATNGIVLYAFVQRALAAGAAALGQIRSLDAGAPEDENADEWQRLSSGDQGLSTEAPYHQGVYQRGERILAVNRPAAEDNAAVLDNARVADLFRGLDFVRVDDQAGNMQSLIQEVWRMFLFSMLAAMLVEAVLCLPKFPRTTGAAA